MSEKQIDLTEEVNLILEGADVTDEFKGKVSTLLETSISAKVKELSENLEAENTIKLAAEKDELIETLEEANAQYEETLEENVSKYLEYVINEWMEENKLAIDAGIKVERAENFMEGLQHLFSENFVEVPESGDDVIAISESKISEMESKLDAQLDTIANLKESNVSLLKDRAIATISEGMTDTEIEKLTSLSEDVSFTDETSFVSKVSLIKESYFKESTSDEVITEEIVNPSMMSALEKDKQSGNPMDKYLTAFRK